MADKPVESLHASFKEYFNIETFSDATIICKGSVFKVHRIILSTQSAFFAKAFTGEWKESTTGKIDLEEAEATAVEAMLRFMYQFDYNNIHGGSTMVLNAQVYGLAEKYIAPALKIHAQEKFRTAINSGWALDDFPLAVAEAYSSTPETDRGLRDLIVGIADANIEKLLESKLFRDVLTETPGFALDMVDSLSRSTKNWRNSYKCPNCQKIMDGTLTKGVAYSCIHCGSRRSDWNSYVVTA